jgi:branched-chain amino acid transport system ATP-binding protein
MAAGTVLAEGSVEEIKNNEEVIEAYLGHGLRNRGVLASTGATS